MVDMVKRDIYPACCAFMRDVAGAIVSKRAAISTIDCSMEEALLCRLTDLSVEMMNECKALEKALIEVPVGVSMAEEATYYNDVVFAGMKKMRAAADELEIITGSTYWPYPNYSDILFSVH